VSKFKPGGKVAVEIAPETEVPVPLTKTGDEEELIFTSISG